MGLILFFFYATDKKIGIFSLVSMGTHDVLLPFATLQGKHGNN